jgi:hypothetical protein
VSPAQEPLIFVSDSSAEAERLILALRARGYQVVDVPLGLVVPRVAAQRPSLILCDVDADGALQTMGRLRDIPGGTGVDIIFLGEAGRTLDDMADAVFHEGSGFFVRPVDVYALLHKVEALIGAPPRERRISDSFLPPSQRGGVMLAPGAMHTSSRPPSSRNSMPADRPASSMPPQLRAISSVPPGERVTPSSPFAQGAPFGPEAPERPTSKPPRPAPRFDPRAPGEIAAERIPHPPISEELASLLSRAEQRIGEPKPSVPPARMSAEDEVEAVLPADVLAALDEPLDADDDNDVGSASGLGTSGGSETGSNRGESSISTSTGSRAGWTTPGTPAPPPPDPAETEPPPTPPAVKTRPPPSAGPAAGTRIEPPSSFREPFVPRLPQPAIREAQFHTAAADAVTVAPRGLAPNLVELKIPSPASLPTDMHAPAGAPSAPGGPGPRAGSSSPMPLIPTTIGPGDAVRALATAIRARYTGALAFEDARGIRRVVFRDGDFVTAASGAEQESLLAFLVERGDLSADAMQGLGRRVPQFGRHAGAALVAHGHLQQDELWTVLRAHAEWLLARIVELGAGAASLEREVPGRLQAEPAVFGGATGAEVLVEIMRRAIGPDEARARLGGPDAELHEGPASGLLTECALGEHETELIALAKTATLGEALARSESGDFAAVLYALRELGILETARRGKSAAKVEPLERDEVDDDALRAKILARKALVEDGDYFSLLGVGPRATSYDIRRAYAELKRQFDPGRVLTARTVDLQRDLDVIHEVIDEAYEILKDDQRRERYRRAIEGAPRS